MSSCPTSYNEDFNKLVTEQGAGIAAKVWNAIQDGISNPDLLSRTVAAFTTQEKITKGLDNKNTAEEIALKIENPEIELEGKNYVQIKTREKVKNRVTHYKRQFEIEIKKYDSSQSASEFYATKGTTLHAYFQEIIEQLKSGKIPTKKDVQNKIMNQLRTSDEFKGKDDSFFQLTDGQFDTLISSTRLLIDEIRNRQKDIDPKGKSRIYTEVPLFDQLYSDAGTADLIVIFSDGSASIYDFKSYVGKPGKAPYQGKIEGWEIQMQNYKNMLKRVYGVNKFRETRVIPIQVQYDKKVNGKRVQQESGFQSISMYNPTVKIDSEYLMAIPIQEFTGNEGTDKILTQLYDQIKNKRAAFNNEENVNKRFKIQRDIDRYKKAVDQIVLYRNLNGVIDIVRNLYKSVKDRVHLDESNERHMTLAEVKDTLDEFNMYSNIQSLYRDEIVTLPDDQRIKLQLHLENMNAEVDKIKQILQEKLLESLPDDIRDAGNSPSKYGRLFKGLSDWNIPIFRELNKYLRYAGEKTRRDSLREISRIQEVDKEFSEWAKNNGYNQNNKFDILYNPETGRLYEQFEQTFWDKRKAIKEKLRKKEALTSEEQKFVHANFELDEAKFKKHRETVFKNIEYSIKDEGHANPQAEYNLRTTKWLKSHNVMDSQGNFLLSTHHVFDYLVPKNVETAYINSKWTYIQNNPAVKKYYDMYINYNKFFAEHITGKRIYDTFVPEIQQNVIDRFVELGPAGLKDIGISIERIFALREQDPVMGVRDSDGNYKQEIPLLFYDPIRYLSSTDKKRIEDEVSQLFPKESIEYNAEIQRREDLESIKGGKKIKSRDLTKSLMLFVNSAYDHINLSSIEGEIKAMKYLIDNEMVAEAQLSDSERKIVNRFTKDVMMRQKGMTSDNIKAFEDFVDMFLYKRRFETDSLIGKKYSRNKVIGSLMNYLTFKALALDMVISSANFIQGRTGLYFKSKEDIHFGKIELQDSINSFKPASMRDEKFNMIVEFFEPSVRNVVREKIDESGATFKSRLLTQKTAFIGHIMGDNNIDNLIANAMSKRYVVDSDGKIKNPKIHTIIDPNAKTVFDSIEMVNGNPVIAGLSLEAAADFRAKIQKISYQVKGMTSDEHKGLYHRSIVWSTMMQFKSWLPGLYEERLGQFRYDESLEAFDEGKFRVAFGEIIGRGILPAAKTASKLLLQVVGLGKVKPDSEFALAQLQEFIKENPEKYKDFTVEDMVKMKEAKLRSLISELRMYLGFMVLVQLIGGLDWDDEDEGNIFTWNAHKITRRALLELSFWYSPNSANEIIRTPIPLSSILIDLTKWADNTIVEGSYMVKGSRSSRDKTPVFYYTLKQIPMANQVVELTGYFNEYQRPKTTFEKVFENTK